MILKNCLIFVLLCDIIFSWIERWCENVLLFLVLFLFGELLVEGWTGTGYEIGSRFSMPVLSCFL